MNELIAERDLADQLEELGRAVRRLREEIRGSAISARADRVPRFPTETERRLRPLYDQDD